MLYFGIDFRHAVEFSRIGRTPHPQPFGLDSGATCVTLPDQIHRVKTRFLPIFTPRLNRRSEPEGAFRPRLALGGSERPAASASRTRSNKRNITDIRAQDTNRGPGVPLATSVTRVSASSYPHRAPPLKPGAGETADGWERRIRSHPSEYRIVQQTPLGEWPLVAAKCEARGSWTGRHLV